MIGSTEIIVIALVILVLFGATAIPKFARSLGRAKAELEKGIKEGQKEAEGDNKKETEKQG
jgi:sec-independent protein translocase protein TatA